jgi:hypothetical protein
MHPAFSSTRAAAGFGLLLALSIALPLLLGLMDLPTREQAFSSLPTAAGPVGMMKQLIFEDTGRADVVFVGSSLIGTDVQAERLACLLSRQTGHRMRVDILELNWYGADQQYFMLKDYLSRHPPPKLVVLHIPQVRAYENRPHPQAYRWLRYGDLPELPGGFPLLSKLQLYGEMVLGGPRQLLSVIRPNLIGREDEDPPEPSRTGTSAETSSDAAAGAVRRCGGSWASVPEAALETATSPLFQVVKPSLLSDYRFAIGPYPLFFMKRMADLVSSRGAALVLIHLPLGRDPVSSTVQEIVPWDTLFGPDIKIIAVPKDRLFEGLDPGKFYRPGDNHMNPSGGERFTTSIAPSVATAYLAASNDQPGN